MQFALINRGVNAPITSQVTPEWLAKVAAAVTTQMSAHVGANWLVQGASVSVSDGTGLAPGTIAFALVDDLPDAPGAIAYHATDGTGLPVAFLALDTCSSLDDVSTGISHECCETLGDAECNLWAGTEGIFYARELCDAVESTSYDLDGIRLSDFVYPSFFTEGAQGPYSYCQDHFSALGPPAPFATARGGYQVYFQWLGVPLQVNAKRKHAMHAARMAHWSSRSHRRQRALRNP